MGVKKESGGGPLLQCERCGESITFYVGPCTKEYHKAVVVILILATFFRGEPDLCGTNLTTFLRPITASLARPPLPCMYQCS